MHPNLTLRWDAKYPQEALSNSFLGLSFCSLHGLHEIVLGGFRLLVLHSLLGPAPHTGTGTIAFDPTFGSFTLFEPVSH
jgi:hypothetical protein